MENKDAAFTIRVDAELRDAFVTSCKANDISAAQVVRAAMRDYINKNAQQSLPLTGKGKAKRGAKANG